MAHVEEMRAPVPFHAMVLAAGFGTRLRPLTDEIPKPLVPILGKPLLGLILEKLHEQRAQKLVVNAHYHSDKIDKYIKGVGFNVHVSHEVKILGTAGALSQVRTFLEGAPVVLVNGDILGELPVELLLGVADSGLTLAVAGGPEGEPGTGTVGVGQRGEVVRLRGEVFGEEAYGADYMGVALVGDQCLATLPEEGCLIGDWALPHLRRGGEVRTVLAGSPFEDVGTPLTYLEAHLRRLPEGGMMAAAGEMGSGVQIRRSFVGEGVRLTGKGEVEECVILGDFELAGALQRTIVTPRGLVMPVPRALGTSDN